jgi:uncharacterized membrane protein
MFGSECFDFSLWWIFPLVMIALCFFVMRGRGSMMCGAGSYDTEKHLFDDADSSIDILNKKYALGEIEQSEYEEKKRTLDKVN